MTPVIRLESHLHHACCQCADYWLLNDHLIVEPPISAPSSFGVVSSFTRNRLNLYLSMGNCLDRIDLTTSDWISGSDDAIEVCEMLCHGLRLDALANEQGWIKFFAKSGWQDIMLTCSNQVVSEIRVALVSIAMSEVAASRSNWKRLNFVHTIVGLLVARDIILDIGLDQFYPSMRLDQDHLEYLVLSLTDMRSVLRCLKSEAEYVASEYGFLECECIQNVSYIMEPRPERYCPLRFCSGCKKFINVRKLNRRTLKVCAKCHLTEYCSKQCQIRDHPKHKLTCIQKINT